MSAGHGQEILPPNALVMRRMDPADMAGQPVDTPADVDRLLSSRAGGALGIDEWTAALRAAAGRSRWSRWMTTLHIATWRWLHRRGVRIAVPRCLADEPSR